MMETALGSTSALVMRTEMDKQDYYIMLIFVVVLMITAQLDRAMTIVCVIIAISIRDWIARIESRRKEKDSMP